MRRLSLGLDARPAAVWCSAACGPAKPAPLARAWLALDPELRARWQVVAVPRHARARRTLAAEARGAGVAPSGRTANAEGWHWDARPGVLMAYYAAGDVAFVGGSLVPSGGTIRSSRRRSARRC